MDTLVMEAIRVRDARNTAYALLSDLPGRWRHTAAVASRAAGMTAGLSGGDRACLLAAAWLHDIGYAAELVETGFHPLDGARFLDRHGWPCRLSALVAHHSGAAFLATVYDLGDDLGYYDREESAVSDALTYADQITGPNGELMSLRQRQTERLARHGPGSAVAQVDHVRVPFLFSVANRAEQRLRSLPA